MNKGSHKSGEENKKRKEAREKLCIRKVIIDKVVREYLFKEMSYQNKTN